MARNCVRPDTIGVYFYARAANRPFFTTHFASHETKYFDKSMPAIVSPLFAKVLADEGVLIFEGVYVRARRVA